MGIGRLGEWSYFPWYDHARAVWHVIQSDKVQREMAVKSILALPSAEDMGAPIGDLKQIRPRLLWAQKQADALAVARNIVVHSPVTFRAELPPSEPPSQVKFVPTFGGTATRIEHSKRLDEIKGLKLWRGLRDDILKLVDYLRALNMLFFSPAFSPKGQTKSSFRLPPLPRKPRLQSLARFQSIASRLSQEAQKQAQRTRKKPSRGKSQKKP